MERGKRTSTAQDGHFEAEWLPALHHSNIAAVRMRMGQGDGGAFSVLLPKMDGTTRRNLTEQ